MEKKIINILVITLLISVIIIPITIGVSKSVVRDEKTVSLDSLNEKRPDKLNVIKLLDTRVSYQDMGLTSSAFEDDGVIPVKYTCDSEDQIGISPPLTISNIPENTLSLAIIVDDPDASNWVHWVVYDIPSPQPTASTLELLEDAGKEGGNKLPEGAKHGINSWPSDNSYYRGPCPPSGVHHYVFTVYALDTILDLQEGLSRSDLDREMNGYIIETAELTGIYGHGINQPPTVEISSPSEDETVSGMITIQGTAVDSDGTVSLVEVKIDEDSWNIASGTTSWSHPWDTTMVNNGEYTIYARSRDNDDAYSMLRFVTVTVDNDGNQPPNEPTCRYDKNNDEIVISTVDPDGDQVRYGVSWNNDGNIDQWTDLVPSGTEKRINCDGRKGTAGVIAEDEHGAQSDWVSVKSKNKPSINTLFFQFLQVIMQRFPLLAKLLQPLIFN